MFRAIISPIFRSTRLCVTACDIMHPRCCRPPATSCLYYLYRQPTICNNNGLLIIPVRSTCFGQLFRPSSGALDCVLHIIGCLYYLCRQPTICNNNSLLIIPVSSPCFGKLFYPSSGALDCVLQFVGALYHKL